MKIRGKKGINEMMISSRKETALFFLAISNFLITRYGIINAVETNFEPDFIYEIEEYPEETKIITVTWANEPEVQAQPISKLSRTMRREICVAAKELAKLDGMGPKEDLYNPYGYSFIWPDHEPKKELFVYGMRCSTIPVSFVYLSQTSNEKSQITEDRNYDSTERTKINILLKENKFKSDHYDYIKKLVTPDEAPVLQDFIRTGPLTFIESQLSLAENIIVKPDTNLLDICHAAKIGCGHEPAPVLNKLIVEKPQMYQFSGHLAYTIECPSSPPMYLNVTDLKVADSKEKINVIIVMEAETESKAEVSVEQKRTKTTKRPGNSSHAVKS